MFLYSNKRCIPEEFICDGEKDCPEGDDEMTCFGAMNFGSG